jgi:hypothetical protein
LLLLPSIGFNGVDERSTELYLQKEARALSRRYCIIPVYVLTPYAFTVSSIGAESGGLCAACPEAEVTPEADGDGCPGIVGSHLNHHSQGRQKPVDHLQPC